MVSQEAKKNLLHEMGIITWQLRRQQIEPATPCYVYPMFDATKQWQGCCLAQASEHTASEQRLLQAIVNALGCQATGLWYENFPDIEETIQERGVWVLMGHNIANHYLPQLAEQKVIATHALSELLQQPLLKAELWQALS